VPRVSDPSAGTEIIPARKNISAYVQTVIHVGIMQSRFALAARSRPKNSLHDASLYKSVTNPS
jgi:hypothetical protein